MVALIGTYTYEDLSALRIFEKYLWESDNNNTNFYYVNSLSEGLYGVTHVRAYIALLEQLKEDRVIFTDIRDVVIQGDLSTMPMGDLDFYHEYDKQTIGNCPYNASWIYNYYGEEGLRRLKDKRIINCSLLSGKREKVLEYCKLWLKEMMRFPPENGIDMSTHNYLYYTGQTEANLVKGQFPVYTCGYDPYIIVDKHNILNGDGNIPFMVHQHDRHLRVL